MKPYYRLLLADSQKRAKDKQIPELTELSLALACLGKLKVFNPDQ